MNLEFRKSLRRAKKAAVGSGSDAWSGLSGVAAASPPPVERDTSAEISLKGWLYRLEGSPLMLWKKRWCVLAQRALFVYKAEDEQKLVVSIALAGYTVRVCSARDHVSHKNAFVAEHAALKAFYLAADSNAAMCQWRNAMAQAAVASLADKAFSAGGGYGVVSPYKLPPPPPLHTPAVSAPLAHPRAAVALAFPQAPHQRAHEALRPSQYFQCMQQGQPPGSLPLVDYDPNAPPPVSSASQRYVVDMKALALATRSPIYANAPPKPRRVSPSDACAAINCRPRSADFLRWVPDNTGASDVTALKTSGASSDVNSHFALRQHEKGDFWVPRTDSMTNRAVQSGAALSSQCRQQHAIGLDSSQPSQQEGNYQQSQANRLRSYTSMELHDPYPSVNYVARSDIGQQSQSQTRKNDEGMKPYYKVSALNTGLAATSNFKCLVQQDSKLANEAFTAFDSLSSSSLAGMTNLSAVNRRPPASFNTMEIKARSKSCLDEPITALIEHEGEQKTLSYGQTDHASSNGLPLDTSQYFGILQPEKYGDCRAGNNRAREVSVVSVSAPVLPAVCNAHNSDVAGLCASQKMLNLSSQGQSTVKLQPSHCALSSEAVFDIYGSYQPSQPQLQPMNTVAQGLSYDEVLSNYPPRKPPAPVPGATSLNSCRSSLQPSSDDLPNARLSIASTMMSASSVSSLPINPVTISVPQNKVLSPEQQTQCQYGVLPSKALTTIAQPTAASLGQPAPAVQPLPHHTLIPTRCNSPSAPSSVLQQQPKISTRGGLTQSTVSTSDLASESCPEQLVGVERLNNNSVALDGPAYGGSLGAAQQPLPPLRRDFYKSIQHSYHQPFTLSSHSPSLYARENSSHLEHSTSQLTHAFSANSHFTNHQQHQHQQTVQKRYNAHARTPSTASYASTNYGPDDIQPSKLEILRQATVLQANVSLPSTTQAQQKRTSPAIHNASSKSSITLTEKNLNNESTRLQSSASRDLQSLQSLTDSQYSTGPPESSLPSLESHNSSELNTPSPVQNFTNIPPSTLRQLPPQHNHSRLQPRGQTAPLASRAPPLPKYNEACLRSEFAQKLALSSDRNSNTSAFFTNGTHYQESVSLSRLPPAAPSRRHSPPRITGSRKLLYDNLSMSPAKTPLSDSENYQEDDPYCYGREDLLKASRLFYGSKATEPSDQATSNACSSNLSGGNLSCHQGSLDISFQSSSHNSVFEHDPHYVECTESSAQDDYLRKQMQDNSGKPSNDLKQQLHHFESRKEYAMFKQQIEGSKVAPNQEEASAFSIARGSCVSGRVPVTQAALAPSSATGIESQRSSASGSLSSNGSRISRGSVVRSCAVFEKYNSGSESLLAASNDSGACGRTMDRLARAPVGPATQTHEETAIPRQGTVLEKLAFFEAKKSPESPLRSSAGSSAVPCTVEAPLVSPACVSNEVKPVPDLIDELRELPSATAWSQEPAPRYSRTGTPQLSLPTAGAIPARNVPLLTSASSEDIIRTISTATTTQMHNNHKHRSLSLLDGQATAGAPDVVPPQTPPYYYSDLSLSAHSASSSTGSSSNNTSIDSLVQAKSAASGSLMPTARYAGNGRGIYRKQALSSSTGVISDDRRRDGRRRNNTNRSTQSLVADISMSKPNYQEVSLKTNVQQNQTYFQLDGGGKSISTSGATLSNNVKSLYMRKTKASKLSLPSRLESKSVTNSRTSPTLESASNTGRYKKSSWSYDNIVAGGTATQRSKLPSSSSEPLMQSASCPAKSLSGSRLCAHTPLGLPSLGTAPAGVPPATVEPLYENVDFGKQYVRWPPCAGRRSEPHRSVVYRCTTSPQPLQSALHASETSRSPLISEHLEHEREPESNFLKSSQDSAGYQSALAGTVSSLTANCSALHRSSTEIHQKCGGEVRRDNCGVEKTGVYRGTSAIRRVQTSEENSSCSQQSMPSAANSEVATREDARDRGSPKTEALSAPPDNSSGCCGPPDLVQSTLNSSSDTGEPADEIFTQIINSITCPSKIDIPERYVSESDSDADFSAVERLARYQKADTIRRRLAASQSRDNAGRLTINQLIARQAKHISKIVAAQH